MNDRNKTSLTHEVTNATSQWLDLQGFKPIETEVSVEPGWCADLAAVISPTQTELIDLKLIKRPPSWNEMNSLITKRRTWDPDAYVEWTKERNALSRVLTCLVEVKTSRGDFKGDRKWTATAPVDLAYLAVPKGLIAPDEWPIGWGILEYTGDCMRPLRAPSPHVATVEQQRDVILEIATRRDHHTRYARFREVQKVERIDRAEGKTVSRVADITRAILSIVHGEYGTIEAALERNNIPRNLPWWAMQPLTELWNIQPKDLSPTE